MDLEEDVGEDVADREARMALAVGEEEVAVVDVDGADLERTV